MYVWFTIKPFKWCSIWTAKSIPIRIFYPMLFYHPKKPHYQLYNTILLYSQHLNFYFSILLIKIIFLSNKIYFFFFFVFSQFSPPTATFQTPPLTLLSSSSTQLRSFILHHPYQPRSAKQGKKKTALILAKPITAKPVYLSLRLWIGASPPPLQSDLLLTLTAPRQFPPCRTASSILSPSITHPHHHWNPPPHQTLDSKENREKEKKKKCKGREGWERGRDWMSELKKTKKKKKS